jgi:hypothetical protein
MAEAMNGPRLAAHGLSPPRVLPFSSPSPGSHLQLSMCNLKHYTRHEACRDGEVDVEAVEVQAQEEEYGLQ